MTADPAAMQALARAEQTLNRDRSYRFDAVETVVANARATTRITGTVVRAAGVTYTLTVGHTRTQVVRVRSATYVRKLPGRWAKLHRKTTVADPTTSLTALLHGLAGASMAGADTLTGTLSDAAARVAGIPTDGTPAHVTITVDGASHVTAVAVRTTTNAGGKAVAVTLATTYSAFDKTRTLRPPV